MGLKYALIFKGISHLYLEYILYPLYLSLNYVLSNSTKSYIDSTFGSVDRLFVCLSTSTQEHYCFINLLGTSSPPIELTQIVGAVNYEEHAKPALPKIFIKI